MSMSRPPIRGGVARLLFGVKRFVLRDGVNLISNPERLFLPQTMTPLSVGQVCVTRRRFV